MTTGVIGLPTPTSSFLGRERELADANQLLRGSRLVTVTGPGGAGKTRFALELARRAGDERRQEYEDGVFASFLAPLRDPSLVLATIAQTLSIREQPGQLALDAIASSLGGRSMLLVLDNLEHLLACRDDVGRVVAACPGLSLLVTSRERLRIHGEVEYELPPMKQTEGVSLFCERAFIEPSATVEEVTLRLEGLPLAIELAAARTKLLTPKQLLERLSSRLDLLKAGSDVDPRQETLRATIRWSYDLLFSEEQTIFARLSVFVGGCTLEAAAEVALASAGALESLIDKSLLLRSDTELGPRFGMLETIREFAFEMLDASGEADSVFAAHSRYFGRLAETLASERYGTSSAEQRSHFEADGANLQAVLSRAIRDEDASTALRLVRNLGDLMHGSSGTHESLRIAKEALSLPGGDAGDRAHALLRASRFAAVLGDADEYRSLSMASEAIFADARDTRGRWSVVQERLFYEGVFRDYATAIREGERALIIAREIDDGALEMITISTLAVVRVEWQYLHGFPDRDVVRQARKDLDDVFAWVQDFGTRFDNVVMTFNVACALCLLSEHEEALDLTQRSLRIGVNDRVQWALLKEDVLWIGFAAVALEIYRVGVRLVSLGLFEFEKEGQPLQPATARLRLETEAAARAALGDETFEQEMRLGRELAPAEAIELALTLRSGSGKSDAYRRVEREVTSDE